MPNYLIKPAAGTDFYVLWSPLASTPVDWGTRVGLLAVGDDLTPEEFDAADERGTSDRDHRHGWSSDHLLAEGDTGEDYFVLRSELAEFCAALDSPGLLSKWSATNGPSVTEEPIDWDALLALPVLAGGVARAPWLMTRPPTKQARAKAKRKPRPPKSQRRR